MEDTSGVNRFSRIQAVPGILLVTAGLAVCACDYSVPGNEAALAALLASQTTLTASAGDAGTDAGSGGTATPPPDMESSCENSSGKCIFIAGSVAGNFGPIPVAGSHPITKIDNWCESQKGLLTGTYKAFIVDGRSTLEGRIAEAGSQNNWVLQANTAYYRILDSGLVGVTNANALFDFPLTRSFDSSGEYWSGMSSSTNYAVGLNLCDVGGPEFWDSFAATGELGSLTSTTATALHSGTTSCSNSRRILCVQQ